MKLTQEKCEACQVGAPKVTSEEQEQFLQELDDWIVITEVKETRNYVDNETSTTKKINKILDATNISSKIMFLPWNSLLKLLI